MTKSLKSYRCRLVYICWMIWRNRVPARPATLSDPGTPDQLVMEQHNLIHFPSQPCCKMCVESRGHDSPHREQSKIDAVVLHFRLLVGTWVMEALSSLRASLCEQISLLEPSTRRWCRIQKDGHALRCRSNSQVGA